jgi:undecaprenyl-diphosphatase
MDLVELVKVFVMAVVQGIGEFLPISSSGHLFVLGRLFFSASGGIDENELMTLNILLHAGTLFSILIIFRRRIWEMLTENRRMIFLLIVGTIPTGIVGITVKKFCPFLFNSLWITGIGFLVTGWLLLTFLGNGVRTTRKRKVSLSIESSDGDGAEPSDIQLKTLRTMTLLDALIIGIFQGVAVLPGISRSGTTIVGGILRKLKIEDSAAFSFLLAIPAISMATLLEIYEFMQDHTGTLWDHILPSTFGEQLSAS